MQAQIQRDFIHLTLHVHHAVFMGNVISSVVNDGIGAKLYVPVQRTHLIRGLRLYIGSVIATCSLVHSVSIICTMLICSNFKYRYVINRPLYLLVSHTNAYQRLDEQIMLQKTKNGWQKYFIFGRVPDAFRPTAADLLSVLLITM